MAGDSEDEAAVAAPQSDDSAQKVAKTDAALKGPSPVRKKRKAARKKASETAAKRPVEDTPAAKGAEVPVKLIGFFVILLIVLAGAVFMLTREEGRPGTPANGTAPDKDRMAQLGDIISLDYTGTFPNGTVFATSVEDVAEESGIFTPIATYEPLNFTLGYGGLLKGFEEAVVGMRAQEEKEFTLPPEKAYGDPKPNLIDVVPRIQRSPIVQNVSTVKFIEDVGLQPTVGLEFKIGNRSDYELTWGMRVLEVYNDTVVFRFLPAENNTIMTVFGAADVYSEGDEILIEIKPTMGQRIVALSSSGSLVSGRVVGLDDENVTIDFNNELAGKTLTFKVKLVDITPQ